MRWPFKRPKISVVIVAYDMSREILRTVESFLPPYQTGIAPEDVEILVIENGSARPVAQADREQWPDRVRYLPNPDPKPSPAGALNYGAGQARARLICLVIDGARMASPGLLKRTLQAAPIAEIPVIATLGRHLGEKVQQRAAQEGYDQTVEDAMLERIRWRRDGYRLFDISCLGGSAQSGWFGPLAESNAVTLPRDFYFELGGYDERFDIAGGGIVNLDFFKRAVEHPRSTYFLVLGEATFHQYHGGVTTSRPVSEQSLEDENRTTWEIYVDQYRRIRGADWALPKVAPVLIGALPPAGGAQIATLKAAAADLEYWSRLRRETLEREIGDGEPGP